MAGNTTLTRGTFGFLQNSWQDGSLAAAQTDKKMKLCGCAGIRTLDLTREASPITMTVQLSEAITTGTVTFDLVVNNVKVNKNITMNNTSGKKSRMHLQPGKIIAAKNDDIAIWYTSSVDLAALTIEAWISVEVEWYG